MRRAPALRHAGRAGTTAHASWTGAVVWKTPVRCTPLPRQRSLTCKRAVRAPFTPADARRSGAALQVAPHASALAAAARAAAGGVARPWCAPLALRARRQVLTSLLHVLRPRFASSCCRTGRGAPAWPSTMFRWTTARSASWSLTSTAWWSTATPSSPTSWRRVPPAARGWAQRRTQSPFGAARPALRSALYRYRTRPPAYRSCALHRRSSAPHAHTSALRRKAVGVLTLAPFA